MAKLNPSPREARTLPEPNPLAALQAIALTASNPQALQGVIEERRAQARAREAEILQEQQVAAQTKAREAQRDFQREENALNRAQSGKQFRKSTQVQEQQFNTTTRATKDFRGGQAAQRKVEFTAATAARKAATAENIRQFNATTKATEDFRNAQLGLEQARDDRANRTQFTQVLDTTVRQFKGRIAGLNRGLPEGTKGITMSDLLGKADGIPVQQMMQITQGFDPTDPETDPKKKRRLSPAQQQEAIKQLHLVQGGARLAAFAALQGGTAEFVAEDMAAFVLLKSRGIAPEFQQEFFDTLLLEFGPEKEARDLVLQGQVDAMTTEQFQAFVDVTAKDFVTAVASGRGLDINEQKVFAKFWLDLGRASDKKAAALQRVVAVTADTVALAEGMTEEQRDELGDQLFGAFQQIATMNDVEFESILLPEREPDARVRNVNTEILTLRNTQQKLAVTPGLAAQQTVAAIEDQIRELETLRLNLFFEGPATPPPGRSKLLPPPPKARSATPRSLADIPKATPLARPTGRGRSTTSQRF